MSLIHLELLDKNRQKVLKKLSVFNKEAVLGGGTSLSLQLARRRAVWRDYIDIFWLLKNKLSLSELINLSKKKFKEEFSEKQFLEQLTYYKDIKSFKVEWIKKKYQPKEIKNFLIEQVKKYKRVRISP